MFMDSWICKDSFLIKSAYKGKAKVSKHTFLQGMDEKKDLEVMNLMN